MKVSVVTKTDDSEGYKQRVVVGVFHDNQQAMDYCDHVDPNEETHNVDEYVVDELIEPEDRRDTPCHE